jgi:hypothetical protein
METKDILQFIMIGAVIMGMGLDKVFKWMKPNGKKNGDNGNKLFLDHESRISSNETNIENIGKTLTELKSDNKKIFKGIGDIKIAIAKGS